MGEQNLTKGNLPKQIYLFTLPLMGSFFMQQLYNSADLIFAGNILGKSASAAIGASTLLVTCVIGLFTGLSVGAGILYGRAAGAEDIKAKRKIFYASLLVSVVGGGLLTVAGYFAAPFFLRLLHTPTEILIISTSYIRIYFFGLLPMILYNMISGIIRAGGNSRLPLIVLFAAGIINIGLDAVFLLVCGFGVGSLALATVLSQSVAAIFVLLYYVKFQRVSDEETRGYCFELPLLKDIVLLGLPVGFQNTIITISNIFVQYHINGLGVDAIAAFTNYFKIELFLYYPILAFGQANLYFVSQNLGVGDMERVKRSTRTCILLGLITVIPLEIILLCFGGFFFGLFNPDPDVIAKGLKIIWVTFPFYWLYVFFEVFSNAIRAVGKTIQAMLITLLSFSVLRVILLMLFSGIKGDDIGIIAMIYPLTWVVGAAALAVYWYRLRKSGKILKENE